MDPAKLAAPEEVASLASTESIKGIRSRLGAGEVDGVPAVNGGEGGDVVFVLLNPGKESVDIVHIGFRCIFGCQRHSFFHGHFFGLVEHLAISDAPVLASSEGVPM